MAFNNLLVEIGTEELPPKALQTLAKAFSDNTRKALEAAELSFSDIQWYASPRRLALMVPELQDRQADKVVEKRGPAVSAAFDEQGQPTKAAQGWARSNGIDVDQAERLTTDKGEWLLFKAHQSGQALSALLPDLIQNALKALPIPKPMRWGAYKTQFIRPVHNICMLYGDELVHGEVLGIQSSTSLLGHRFHSEGTVTLSHADEYLATLEEHYVIADFAQRKAQICEGVQKAAEQIGGIAEIEEDLLDEVTALVEWPVTLTASFDKSFLEVPKEALMYTMKDDQKYFPVVDNAGNLMSNFIFVSNIESRDPSQVIAGNEKVIRPRLADAEFFFNSDKKQTLESRLDKLDSILFQKQLGSLKEKSERIAKLSEFIAAQSSADDKLAGRAGLLSKTDLVTSVVMEFPDVQGVMGMHYARIDGEDEQVALALNEQYMPRYSGDALPSQDVGRAVALADKLDTLVGIFGIGQLPKGDKDPFALRRAAIGLLRIIIEAGLDLDVVTLVEKAIEVYADKLTNTDTQQQVVDFIFSRYKAFYQEQGISADVVQAVAVRRPTRPADFDARIKAVNAFKQLEEASALAAANKRVANILAKNNVSTDNNAWDTNKLVDQEEIALADALSALKTSQEQALASTGYTALLTELASLRRPVDAFFDKVMVMAEDESVRSNRLALLNDLRNQFLQIADISLLGSEA